MTTEGEILPAEPAGDPHAVEVIPYPWGMAWRCACQGWEAAASGTSSARWAAAEHRQHVTRATGQKR